MKKVLHAAVKAGRAFIQAYNEKGQEIPDPTPIEVPLKMQRPPDIHEMIAAAVRGERFRQRLESEGRETWEEANDFGENDEDGPVSRYELTEMQEEFYDSDRRNYAANRRSNGRRKDEAGTGHARRSGKADSSDGKSVTGAAGAVEEAEGRSVASGGASAGGKA